MKQGRIQDFVVVVCVCVGGCGCVWVGGCVWVVCVWRGGVLSGTNCQNQAKLRRTKVNGVRSKNWNQVPVLLTMSKLRFHRLVVVLNMELKLLWAGNLPTPSIHLCDGCRMRNKTNLLLCLIHVPNPLTRDLLCSSVVACRYTSPTQCQRDREKCSSTYCWRDQGPGPTQNTPWTRWEVPGHHGPRLASQEVFEPICNNTWRPWLIHETMPNTKTLVGVFH